MIGFEYKNRFRKCVVCSTLASKHFFQDKFRAYRRCHVCSIIFVPEEFYVSAESEKARYEEHNNNPNDVRYRNFLERIALPIRERFEKGARGLDFGCGPTPLLSDILKADGFEMEVYDPFYVNDESVLEQKYDFIVSTEVFEHLKSPLSEFEKLFSLLKPNGVLAIMTRPYDESIDFKTWHYKNDRTHICFYTVETFNWIAVRLGLEYSRVENDIFVFKAKSL